MLLRYIILFFTLFYGLHSSVVMAGPNYSTSNHLDESFPFDLQKDEFAANHGSVYRIRSQVNRDQVKVENILTNKIFTFKTDDLSYETLEYSNIRQGDVAIVLSNSASEGVVWKIFTDGTTVLITDKNTFIIGNRPQKKIDHVYFDYVNKTAIIDDHHYQGIAKGFFENNFLLYNYQSLQKPRHGQLKLIWEAQAAKILFPPFSRNNYNQWLLGLASEYYRGDYTHRGKSKAQFAIAKKIFKESFGPNLLRHLYYMSNDQFYKLIKHLLWSENSPRDMAIKIKTKIYYAIKEKL